MKYMIGSEQKFIHFQPEGPLPPEVKDFAERIRLTIEVIEKTKKIIVETSQGQLEGYCEKGAVIAQKLLAEAGVRTLLIDGMYRADEEPTRSTRDYSHWWLYESATGSIPATFDEASELLKIIDPTREQFDARPKITNLDGGRHIPTDPSSEPYSDFIQDNAWLWSPEELEQWKTVIKLLIRHQLELSPLLPARGKDAD